MSDDQREALQRLREQIRAAAPDATETIAYGVPSFRLHGRYFLSFGATRGHCSFYPGKAPIEAYADELADFPLRKGTIQFQPDHPIPAGLVAKLVKVRLAEHRARWPASFA